MTPTAIVHRIVDEGLEYPTSDQTMAEVLMMRGHSPARITYSDNHITFHFVDSEVRPDIILLLANRGVEMTVNIQDWYRAKTTWQSTLRYFAGSKAR